MFTRRSVVLSLGIALIGACGQQETPRPEGARLGVDTSWWRMASRQAGSHEEPASWLTEHARVRRLPIDLRERVSGRLQDLITHRATGGYRPVNLLNATGTASWTLPESSPISTSAAVLVFGDAQDNAADRLVIEGAGTGAEGDPAHYIGIVRDLYTASPAVTKSPPLDAGIDGSALVSSLDGTMVYAVSRAGTVYAVRVSDGTFAWTYAMPAGVSWSSPWLDYGSYTLYVADLAGDVVALNSTTGAVRFSASAIAGAGVAIHSSPITYNNVLWVGADDGKLYRRDAVTGAALGLGTDLCDGTCDGYDQIWGSASIDSVGNKLLIGVNRRIIQIDLSSCGAAAQACGFTAYPIQEGGFVAPAGRFYSTPIIDDPASGHVYFGFANRLWRASYAGGLTSAFTRAQTADPTGLLRGVMPVDDGFPRGLPIPWGGQLFIGDGGGYMHRFSTTTFAEEASARFANGSISQSNLGPAIDSTPLIDVLGGNLYFGVRNPNAPVGKWVSLPQGFADVAPAPGPAVSLRVSTTGSVASGTPISVTVTAFDAQGNTAPSYAGTIHFTSSDGAATLPADYAFVAGDGGVRTFSVTLRAAGLQSLSATDTGAPTITGTATVTVSPTSATRLDFYATFGVTSTKAGTPVSVSVIARDANDNVVPSYQGVVHFSSTDPSATLPADYAFQASDGGIHHFLSSVVPRTAGSTTITVSDAMSGLSGSLTLTVIPGAVSRFSVSAPGMAMAGVPFSVTVTAQDAQGNTVPGYAGTISFSNTGAGVVPSSYTFGGSDAGAHTFVSGVRLDSAGTQTVSVADVSSPSIKGSANVTVGAGGATRLQVYPTFGVTSVQAGSAMSVSVIARDALDNVVKGYTGTVHFTSTDGNATLPADYAYQAADQGVHHFYSATTLRTAGSRQVTVSDTVSGISGSFTVTVTPGPVARFAWSAPAAASSGQAFSAAVTAQDSSGNVIVGYTGTVRFTSSDATATLPADYAFTGADAGTHTFGGIVLRTAGAQTLTATDVANSSVKGSAPVTVGAAVATRLQVYTTFGVTSTSAGTPVSVSIIARDGSNNVVKGYNGTVHFTSTDGNATVPADYTFQASDNGVHHFYSMYTPRTVGSQTVTATDTSTAIAGSFALTVNVGPVAGFTVTAPASTTAGTPVGVTVVARDSVGNTVTGYTGTVGFTSNDAAATVPASYTFLPGDAGVHTFAAGVTFRTKGGRTVTATDLSLSTVKGSATVSVAPGPLAVLQTYPTFGVTSVAVGQLLSVSVVARDPFNNVISDYAGTVGFSSTDPGATLSAPYTFQPSEGGVHHFYTPTRFASTGPQSVSISDTAAGVSGTVSVTVTP